MSRKTVTVTVAGQALAAGVLLLALSSCGTATTAAAPATTTPTLTRFEVVVNDCPGIPADSVADKGKTLHLDTQGKTDTTGIAMEDIVCVLARLKVPASVTAKIERTSALMGVQTETWDGIEASWTYHPDSGADFIMIDKG